MTKPTHQDATLMVQLAQWGSSMGLEDAYNWIFSDEFVTDYAAFQEKYPMGSEGYGTAFKICYWAETVGTLYKQGLFSGELLFDWLAAAMMWQRLKGFALGMREQYGVPGLWENFEAMAKAQ
ncbi:MAG: hypothetical protein ACK2UQ_12310 [Anaerolineae bacterium]|jgi:hypothetical protein